MDTTVRRVPTRELGGLIILLVGVGFLMQAFGFWDFGTVLGQWWAIVLVLFGLAIFWRHQVMGGFILLLGIVFLLQSFGIAPGNAWAVFWPAIIILIGLSIMTRPHPPLASGKFSDDVVDGLALFSGWDKRNTSGNFKGGRISATFGGAKLDLRDAKIAPEGATLDVFAAFGGITLLVPRDVKVVCDGLPLFGGFDDKTISSDTKNARVLRINGTALFGGVEIKN